MQIDQKTTKIGPKLVLGPWGPLGGDLGAILAPRGTKTPPKEAPVKIRKPHLASSWAQNPQAQIDQNSIKNAIKNQLICRLIFNRCLVQLGFQNHPKILAKSIQNCIDLLVDFLIDVWLIYDWILAGFWASKYTKINGRKRSQQHNNAKLPN